MIINHNISALNTYRQLGINNSANASSMEKLSSGLRINKAGDDAAGLAISEKMRAQVRGLDMASRNSQDAISMIQTAEGALQESHNILQRMRELATQAANDTNVAVDRNEIQKEMNQLTSEINRIGNTTEFNTQKLLDGNLSAESKTSDQVLASSAAQDFKHADVTLVGGLTEAPQFMNGTAQDQIKIEAGGEFATAAATNDDGAIEITRSGDQLQVKLTTTHATDGEIVTAEETLSKDADGNFTYDAHGVSFKLSGEEFEKLGAGQGIKIDNIDGSQTELATKSSFSTNTVVTPGTDEYAEVTGFTVDAKDAGAFANAASVDVSWSGTEANVIIKDKDGNTLNDDKFTLAAGATLSYDNHGISFTFDPKDASAADFSTKLATETATVDQSINFQIGANQNQSLNLSINDMRSVALGISGTSETLTFKNRDGQEETVKLTAATDVTDGTDNKGVERALDVSTHENASKAITVLNNAIESVSAERSKLGATQNRLEHTISNLNNASENLTAAESRVRDVDMAKEVMEMTRANILGQASQAMLAQANQKPQSVLQLLG